MAYYYTHEINGVKREAIFEHLDSAEKLGVITEVQRNKMLGRYFGYPECCIEAFLEDYPDSAPSGEVVECPLLGVYFRCNECIRKGKV